MIRLYGLSQCGTCKKALGWLDQQGVEHSFTDYRDQPISPADLVRYARQLGGWEKLVNRASPTWRKLTEVEQAAITDEQWKSLIARYPALVRRPLTVFADGSVSVGFNISRFQSQLDGR